MGSKRSATEGMVSALSAAVLPACTSAASDFADAASELRCASVICDCIVQETASAGNGVMQANAAQAINTRITIGICEEFRTNGIG
jgi:hypothetical protein